jgi:hypothetical protein
MALTLHDRKAERKYTLADGPVTVDVDELWSKMTAGATSPPTRTEQEALLTDRMDTHVSPKPVRFKSPQSPTAAKRLQDPADMIRIKRKYNFAGKVHTEEKLVPRDSAEAKLYLASQVDGVSHGEPDSTSARKMPKKAFRSAFEPLIEVLPQRGDLNLGMTVRLKAREAKEASAKKLNTVEKSRMDWAGYVDKEGIQDELELAGRSKDSFASRQDFLARSEARRDDDARRARLAGRV